MLRLATRSSRLAIAQCERVAEMLRAAGFEAEPVTIDSAAERRRTGGDDKGRFTRGIERALLDGRADIGVHSAKDLPGEIPAGLILAGAAPRGAAGDAWITTASLRETGAGDGRAGSRGRGGDARSGGGDARPGEEDTRPGGGAPVPAGLRERLAGLPPGARIGTASLRRRSQLLALRNDLSVEELRGNVDTRLRLLVDRRLDAIVLATAGLQRLGMPDVVECEIDPEEMLPAPGQGTLALEIRGGGDGRAGREESDRGGRDNEATAVVTAAIEAISCPATFATLRAERAVSKGLAADCDTPIGALARVVGGDRLRLDGYVGRADGSDWIRDRLEGPLGDPESLGIELAGRMIAAGAMDLLGRASGPSGDRARGRERAGND